MQMPQSRMIMTQCLTKINKRHPTYVYAADVVAGKIVACKKEIQACKRHIKDLDRQGKRNFPFVFDETRAERFYYFAEHLINPDTMEFYKLLPHQKFDFGVLYGWVDKTSGIRRFTKYYSGKSRANAKSTECSFMGLFALSSDCIYPPGKIEEKRLIQSPRIECLAVDRAQAEEVREPAMRIASVTPMLKDRVSVKVTYIKGIKRGGSIKTLSKETKNKQGGKPYLVIVDEYADYTEDKRVNTIIGGMGKREQGLVVFITTAGDDASQKPAKKEYEYASKVLSGEVKAENYLVIIREQDSDSEVKDVSLWGKSNPMLRYSDKYSYSKTLLKEVLEQYERAFTSGDADKILAFKVRRMNLWQESSATKYLTSRHLNILKSLFVSKEEFKNLVYGKTFLNGIDASKTIDLTGLGYVAKLADGRVAIAARGFIPSAGVMRHENTDHVPYRDWIRQEYIFECDGDVVTQEKTCDTISMLEKEYGGKIKEIDYDPAFCTGIAEYLENGKNSFAKKYSTVRVQQTCAYLNEATDGLRNMILQKKIVIEENPALLWCFENAITYKDGGERIRISKRTKDDTQRVDLLAAVITAYTRIGALDSETIINQLENGTFSF